MDALSSKRKVFIKALRPNPTLLAAEELLQRYAMNDFEIAKTVEEAEIVLYLENGYIGLDELPRLLAHVRSPRQRCTFFLWNPTGLFLFYRGRILL